MAAIATASANAGKHFEVKVINKAAASRN